MPKRDWPGKLDGSDIATSSASTSAESTARILGMAKPGGWVEREEDTKEVHVLTEEQKRFFMKPNFGHLATLEPDGSPQVTPVWVDVDDQYILVNSAVGRRKVRNVERDPRVSLEVVEQENPYSMLSLKGKVVEMTTDGADAHIDAMAKKYLGQDSYPFRQPGEERIILKIEPEKVIAP